MGLFHGQAQNDAITCACTRAYNIIGGVSACACARVKSTCERKKRGGNHFCWGFKMKNEWNKWKNHFYEMKGDVGISLHEKERNKMPTPRHKATHNPIPTSLFLPRPQHTFSCVKMLCCLLCLTNKQTNNCNMLKQNKDVGMGL